jgi:hypothetical protein
MQNISGFGLSVSLIASKTFPVGLYMTQFGDDTDPLDVPSLQIMDKSMGLNGDLITWSKPQAIIVNLSVIPFSDSDIQLAILLEANRTGRGKIGARDIITMTAYYPNGDFVIYQNGVITDGMPANGVQSAGRLKTKTYGFAFENKIGA